jgi:D-glycero-alpha-D-manno-heptose-7-phosphate kinase
MIYRGRAPLRVSFAGGGTDLSPYVDEHGGIVLSATIDRYAYASLGLRSDNRIRVRSLDFGSVLDTEVGDPLHFDGNLDLIKGCLRRLCSDENAYGSGIELFLETDAPPGSGLGASSALVVALIGALMEWRQLPLTKYQIAQVAWEIERKDVRIAGGLQDQYAAAFGGFNLIEFHGTQNVVVNPLRVDPDILRELQYNMVLVFTGSTRHGGQLIDQQVAGYVERKSGVAEALHRMKDLTIQAKDSLLKGRLEDFAQLLHLEWEAKQQVAEAVTTDRLNEIYAESRRLGVIGGKISGAGGGGFMLLYCPFDRKAAVIDRMKEMGAEVYPVSFEPEGVQHWTRVENP